MPINIIVAMTRDGVIGDKGTIPWHIREESEHFKELTTGNAVIMGKNTWLSIPEEFRPLPSRMNIIVSSSLDRHNGAIVCKNIEEAVERAENYGKGETFCIGGAKLYEAMLPFTEILHISWIKGDYIGNVRFPYVDFSKWEMKGMKEHNEFKYERYIRKG